MRNVIPAPVGRRLIAVRRPAEIRLRILLVDSDNATLQAMRHEFQEGAGAQLDCESDCEAAMHAVAAHQFDLVIVDPSLPGGFGLLKKVKDTQRWTATLAVTGNLDPKILRQAVTCGLDGLLFEPVLLSELVEHALSLAAAASAKRRLQQKRVLAIGAHPDDVEIGCGGTLARHRAQGDVLRVLTLTRGAAGGDVNQRTIEAQRAAEVLSATLEIADLPDTRVDSVETIDLIEAAIREFQPTHIYTHCAEDTHQDHRAVHEATLVAARRVPNVYCYQTPSTTVDFQPNCFVDVTDFMKQKLQAIDSYKSQVARMDALEHDLIRATARYWGRYANYVLAEPLRVIRQRDNDLLADRGREPSTVEPALLAVA